MAKQTVINVGDTFTTRIEGRTNTFKREENDPSPIFECERIRVTHVACSDVADFSPYTFGTEPEWFTQRGLNAA